MSQPCAPAIAPARSPPLETKTGQEVAAPEAVREAITEHVYGPTVWTAGEAVQEQVQISAAKLQLGSYAVWMEMYALVTQMRAGVKVWHGVVVYNRVLLLEIQLLA